MIKFFEELFEYEKFPTEKECFKQLQNTNLNYIAVPWAPIMNSHWLAFPGNKGRDHYLRILSRFKVETSENFTVCQHSSYNLLIEYYKHFKIKKVFATACTQKLLHIDGVEFIPIPFAFNLTFQNNLEKDILVSFIGTYTTHPVRATLKQNIQEKFFIYRDTYHGDSGPFVDKSKEEKEYRDILERSKFSLCPRGTSPASIRFWECLAAGTVPILISDDWRLPDWNWKETIIQIHERDIANLTYSKLLEKIKDYDYDSLKNNCIKAFNKFKKENFKNYIMSKL